MGSDGRRESWTDTNAAGEVSRGPKSSVSSDPRCLNLVGLEVMSIQGKRIISLEVTHEISLRRMSLSSS